MTYKTQKMFGQQWEPATPAQQAWFVVKVICAAAAAITVAKAIYLVWFVI